MAGGDADDAYRKALGLLVRREQSRRDLKRKLAVRGVDATEAAAAVDRLAAQGFQDDARFAVAFARDRASAGYGPVRIRQELSGHGVDPEGCEAALLACETDWAARAAELVERRFRPAELGERARRRSRVPTISSTSRCASSPTTSAPAASSSSTASCRRT